MNIDFTKLTENQNNKSINGADFMSGNATGRISTGKDVEKNGSVMVDGFIKNLNAASNTGINYDHKTGIDQITSEALTAEVGDTGNLKYMQETMTDVDYSKAKEDGFSLQKDEISEVVTVVDKIKMELAKSGDGYIVIGDDLSREAIEDYTNSPLLANAVDEALKKSAEIEEISDGAITYMVKNELSPTINNLYAAQFSGAAAKPAGEIPKELRPAIENVLAGIGGEEAAEDAARFLYANELPINEDSVRLVMDLGSMEFPIDGKDVLENIANGVVKGNLPGNEPLLAGYTIEDRVNAVMDTLEKADAKTVELSMAAAGDVTLGTLRSAVSIAQSFETIEDALEFYKSDADEDFIAQKTLQVNEIRMAMTFEAGYAIIKKGFNIEEAPLAKVYEAVVKEEFNYFEKLISQSRGMNEAVSGEVNTETGTEIDKFRVNLAAEGSESTGASAEQVRMSAAQIMFETGRAVDVLKTAPAQMAAQDETFEMPLREVAERGAVRADAYRKAGETYEALMTAPRTDLGDRISTAFRNVPDILSDMGLSNTEENARAVRILGYNSIEITAENIERAKYSDLKVQTMFESMTPSATLDMIREGVNPLELSIDELIEKTAEINGRNEALTNEKFSSFLYELENKNGITEDEREAYIGIYRLITQVQNTDGAVIGALMEQGADLSMKNLLTGMRTMKHGSSDIRVDDSVGESEGESGYANSISGQIDGAYERMYARAAYEALTVQTADALYREGNYEDMTPEQLFEFIREAKRQQDADEAAQNQRDTARDYARSEMRMLGELAGSEEQVIGMLDRYDMPKTLYNLIAANRMLKGRGRIYDDLYERGREDSELSDLIEETFERFGEAVKSPEDMAEAQERLADLAENVLRRELESDDASTLNIRNLKIATSAIRLGAEQAREEQFCVPVLVNTEAGTMSLKIVRGKRDAGSVFMSMDNSVAGRMALEVNAKSERIQVLAAVSSAESADILNELRPGVLAAIASGCGRPADGIDMEIVISENLDTAAYIDRAPDSDVDENADAGQRDVQTRTLYNTARELMGVLVGR